MSLHSRRLMRTETIAALCIIVIAALFLIPTTKLAPLSALLPASMLVGLIVLAAVMLLVDQRSAAAGETAEPITHAPKRVMGAFGLVLLYAVSVDLIGFYVSTAVSLPLVAYIFGYRNPVGLAVATCIVLAAIYLIFSISMAQDFPTGLLWSK